MSAIYVFFKFVQIDTVLATMHASMFSLQDAIEPIESERLRLLVARLTDRAHQLPSSRSHHGPRDRLLRSQWSLRICPQAECLPGLPKLFRST